VAELLGLRLRLRDAATTRALNADEAARPSDGPPLPAAGPGIVEDDSESRQIVFSDLRAKLSDFRKRSNAPENTADRVLARRIVNNFMALAFEPAMMLIASKKYELAIQNLSTDTQLMPDNPGLLYSLARAYSLKGDRKRAIETLNRAIEKGFSSAAELEQNHDFDSIRDDPSFTKLVELLKQKQ
jgi:predicted Zn-dependent protease